MFTLLKMFNEIETLVGYIHDIMNFTNNKQSYANEVKTNVERVARR